MFVELDSIHKNDPRGYMALIKSMRNGNFDKEVFDDRSSVLPQNWFDHLSIDCWPKMSTQIQTHID